MDAEQKAVKSALSRREFLRASGRYAFLGGLAAIAARAVRGRKGTAPTTCVPSCADCRQWPICGRREAALARKEKRDARG